MKNMSFSMTTEQCKARTKDVTRRFGWWKVKPGMRLRAVEKAMGLKKGEKVKVLGVIEIVSARKERLDAMTADNDYGFEEIRREGYPFGLHIPGEFVAMICQHYKKKPEDEINRIEFRWIEEGAQ